MGRRRRRMKERWYLRALFAGTVGLAVAAGLARGQSQSPPPPVMGQAGGYVQPVPSYAPGYEAWPDAGVFATGGAGDGDCNCNHKGWLGKSHIVKGMKALIGCDCYTHHNTLGCGNFPSEMAFIFGSCRTFYVEPCM